MHNASAKTRAFLCYVQPTLLSRIGLFTVHLGNVQPPSTWRILALNALNMLVLSSQPLHRRSEDCSLSIFVGFKAYNLSNSLMERLNMSLTRGDGYEESSLDRR